MHSKNLVLEKKSHVKDNYKILDKLGEGSFGAVYKVICLSTKLIRAMKVIKKESLEDQEDEQQFLKEIEILKTIDHPNIVKIFEYYSDNFHYYIIIEFVNGGELYSEIIKWPEFSEKKTAFIMKQIMSALFYLHSLNIVHRDIKPENIMLEKSKAKDDKPQIKLIDFGTCNYLEPGKFLHQTMGTPYFVAPEVLDEKYNHQCDVWSMGVTMYILLAGFPPFMGSNQSEVFNEIKSAELSFEYKEFNLISEEAKDLIRKMLDRDLNKRITAGDCLKHTWIKNNEQTEVVDAKVLQNALTNIKNFNAKEKLQQTAIAYIVHLVQNTKECYQLKVIFSMIDVNGDGRLTYDELREGFQKVFGESLTEFEFERIITCIDQDEDGFIGYEEFLRVALDKKIILTEENLKMAFSKFDENGDGTLSKEELRKIMGAEDGFYFREVMRNLDTDNEGNISYLNFCKLMRMLVSNIDNSKTLNSKERVNSLMGRMFLPSGTISIKKENFSIVPKKHKSCFGTMERNKTDLISKGKGKTGKI